MPQLPENSWFSLSPLDGRYREQLPAVREILSEGGLIYYRIQIELLWLEMLGKKTDLIQGRKITREEIRKILENLDIGRVKAIEKITQHDVKAVEYYLKEILAEAGFPKTTLEFVHFACTSEDINNLAYSLMLKDARDKLLLPLLNQLMDTLIRMAEANASQAMLARTHGQSASPTTLGKEIANVVYRLAQQRKSLKQIPLCGKINGATGNFNAHAIACPEINWLQFSQEFVEALDLHWQPYTTQILPHDDMAELAQNLIRINTILIDFCRDIWGYISLDYFKQKLNPDEVGSSTMPHKINPIHFENAEGNLGIANSLFNFFAEKLPVSRWQRDLTDSTVLRNWGVAVGHSILAMQMLSKGLARLEVNQAVLEEDLNRHWEVLAEAVQTVMRRHGHEAPYEQLKALSRGQQLSAKNLEAFIQTLDLPMAAKKALLALTPSNYTGYAADLAAKIKNYVRD